jgi:flagellar FliJ protein
MKKFDFRLEPVLNHRKLLLDLEMEKMAKIRQSIQEVEDHIRFLTGEVRKCRDTLTKPGPGAIDVDELRMLALYMDKLEKDILANQYLLSSLEEDKRKQSEKLVEAKKKREVIENLKEKSFRNYQQDVKGMEQKLLDELVSVRHTGVNAQNLPDARKNS